MQGTRIKTGLAALAAVVVLVILVILTLPWIASTQIVRDRIASELSAWSGYRVSLGERPVLDVWPQFKATLNDVAFHEWAGGDKPPVLEADRLEVSLSAFSALRGDVVLNSVTMHRPLLRLTTHGPVLDLPASPGGGRMMRAVDMARSVLATDPASPDLGALPGDAFGVVEFFDGRIAISNGVDEDIITSLSGKISWPSLDRAASLSATAIWRGENVAVEGSSTQPLVLLAGGNAPVKASLKSSLLTASFEGMANLSEEAFFDGQASLASPSLRRTLEWSNTDIAPGSAIGAMSISGAVQGTEERVRVDSVALTLGGNAAQGVLDVSFAGDVPAFSGTLAFDKLDLRSFLAAFMPIASGGASIEQEVGTGFAEQLNLDLRLSAATASLGPITLQEVAAASQVKGNLAVFDISDATVLGGSLQAGIRLDGTQGGKTIEFRSMANEIDAEGLAKLAGAERLLPQGKANISVILKGSGEDWASVMGSAEGSVTASLGPGALVGLNLPAFREKWAAGGFFALSEVADGTLPIRGLDFKASINGGLARIEKADILLDGQVATMQGIVPYLARALALSGSFAPVTAEGTRGEQQSFFFIGGGWDAPFVAPALPGAEFE